MKRLNRGLISLTLMGSVFVSSAFADDINQLDDKAKATAAQEQTINQNRLELSQEQRAQLQGEYDALSAKLAEIKQKNDALSQQFTENEAQLAKQNQALELEAGSLGEVFGVARQAAKAAHDAYQNSYLGQDAATFDQTLVDLLDTESMPSMDALQTLWEAMDYKARSASEVVKQAMPFVQGDGSKQDQSVIRLGDMALIGENGFLTWDFDRQQAAQYLVQPSNAATIAQVESSDALLLDPSRGELLSQYANKPTLMQRFEQSGAVGKVIIALLLIGLGIAVVRGVVLSKTQAQIKSQLKNPEQPTDNPLGRILGVYNKEKKQSVNSLELRLLESILDEQQGLEKGLSMLKLLAALAPMLGLLGTVTGMIQTFQVITEFGNGDPKVMAGGISMALSTTVLGLVAAIPLLLAHNLLSNRAEAIRGILEKQGVSLVAEQAEAAEQSSGMQQASA
ncbi:MAG: MotA/TolQ/ExbB proton channel family protein [Vibrio sp.]